MSGLCLILPACFDGTPSASATIVCAIDDECPAPLACVLSLQRCVNRNDPCVRFDGDGATVEVDGADCGDDGDDTICVDGACLASRCGDGVVHGDETCDGEADCRNDCTRCGDSIINGEGANGTDIAEACDNGAQNNDTTPGACRTSCRAPSCGDGVRDPGEGCDDGDGNDDTTPGACRTTCAPAGCGDGVRDDNEDCDNGDGNTDTFPNACRTTCANPSCGDGVVDDGEVCDDGVANSDVRANACRTTCVLPTCGDGARDLNEGCDDGDDNSNVIPNACREDCARPFCGDGVIDDGEVCDSTPDCGEGCRKVSECGDGIVDVGEDCDDANANDFDGCDQCRRSIWQGTLLNRLTPDGPEPTRSTIAPRAVFVQATSGRMVIASGCRILQFPSSQDGGDPSQKPMVPVAGSPTCRSFEEPVAADGNFAASARFRGIASVAVDVQQNIYFIEDGTQFVRRIGLDGRLSTVRVMQGQHIGGMTADQAGRVWWVEGSAILRKAADDTVSVVAGAIQSSGSGGDGGPATAARFLAPVSLAVLPDGGLLVGDSQVNRVRIIGADGVIVAGPTFSTPVRLVAATESGRRLVFAENRIFELTDTLPRVLFGDGTVSAPSEEGPARGGAIRPSSMSTDGEDIIIAELGWVRRLGQGFTPIIAGGFGNLTVPDGGFPTGALATGTPLSAGVGIAFDDEGRLLSVDENRSLMRVELDGTASRRVAELTRPILISSRAGRTVVGDSNFTGCKFVDESGVSSQAGCAVSAGPSGLTQDALGQVIFAGVNGDPVRSIKRINLDGSVIRLAGAGFGDPTIDGPAVDSLLRIAIGFSMTPDDTLVFVEGGENVMHIDADGILRRLATGSQIRHTAVTDDGTVYFADFTQVFRILPDGNTEAVTSNSGERDNLGLGQPASSVAMAIISGFATDGTRLCVATDVVRCFVPGGLVEGILGAIDPSNLGPVPNTHLPDLQRLVVSADGVVLGATGGTGRIVRLTNDFVDVAIGVRSGLATLAPRLQPLFADAVDLTVTGPLLVVVDRLGPAPDPFDFDPPPRHGEVRGFLLDDAGLPSASVDLQTPILTAPSGVALVDSITLAISDGERHTVSLVNLETGAAEVIVGIDGLRGRAVDRDVDGTRVLLSSPGSMVVSGNGDLYIADVGNNQVLRRSLDGRVRRILGDPDGGSGIGSGTPSSLVPLATPGQLNLDRQGNLYVAAGRSLRVVYADDDGTIDGTGESEVIFSAASANGAEDSVLGELADVTRCLSGVTLVDDRTLLTTDRCVGGLIELRRP